MYENPSFSKDLNEISVKVCNVNGESGSGILYKSCSDTNNVFLVTAKHCLMSGSASSFLPEDINLLQSATGNIYHLNKDDKILFHSTQDLAIVQLSLIDAHAIFGNIPTLLLAKDNAGEKEVIFYGFPQSFSPNIATRVDAQILPPVLNGIISLETTLKSELNLTENTVVGLSGSGIAVKCGENIYLFGIIIQFDEWNRFVGLSIKYINEILTAYSLPKEPMMILEGNPELIRGYKILRDNSKNLLDNINDKIGDVQIDRSVHLENAISILGKNNVLLVAGVAGSGKSTFSKMLINHLESQNTKIISFFGTQICKTSSTELLSLLGISKGMDELLESRDLTGPKIVYIDSAEKGFEHRQIEIIKELIKLTNTRKDLKLILSVRSYALSLSTFGLLSSTSVSWDKIDMELLDDKEIAPVVEAFPKVKRYLKNPKIESLIRTPFYLNLLVSFVNELGTDELNELGLKNRLWQEVIRRDSGNRETIFTKIALERARMMMPFVLLPEGSNDSDVQVLLSDHVIKENIDAFDIRSYAPAHDIFEDWALVRYMRTRYSEIGNLNSFLNQLEVSYSLRRGFRFWLQEVYRTDSNSGHDITLKALTDGGISDFWKDEVIIAMLNSSGADVFFVNNEKILFENEGELLIRIIHLLRTACKSMNKRGDAEFYLDERTYMTSDILKAIGPGWDAITSFLSKRFERLTEHNYLISQVLLDWDKQDKEIDRETSIKTLPLIHHLIKLFSKSVGRSNSNGEDKLCEKLIKIAFRQTRHNLNDIEDFVRKSFEAIKKNNFINSEVDELGLSRAFHKRLLEMSMDYYSSEELCKFLPSMICEIAEYRWTDIAENEAKAKYKDEHEDQFPSIMHSLNFKRDPDEDELFGLSRSRRNFYPASSFQTPLPHLLRYNAEIGLNFLIQFINRSVNTYVSHKPKEVKKVSIKLNNGSKTVQFGNQLLWRLYRGHHNAPNLITSLHMALENHLLDLQTDIDERSKKELDFIVNKLFKESISISTTAIIASAAEANPFVVGTNMLPIFSFKESFKWDLDRLHGEREIFTPPDISGNNPRAQKERIESKNLPHRKNKLEFLVFKMSFYDGYALPVSKFIKQFYKDINARTNQDWDNWQYVLWRIDRSKYKIGEIKENGFILEPDLPTDIMTKMKEAREELEAESGVSVWNWCHLIIDKDEQEKNTLELWRHYKGLSEKLMIENSFDNQMYNTPTGIASIGLSFHGKGITEKEKEWCVRIILEVSTYYIEEEKKRFNTDFGKYASWNKDIVIAFLPHLLNSTYGNKTVEVVKEIISNAIVLLKVDDGNSKPLFEKMAKECWISDTDFSIRCFRKLVELAVKPKSDLNENLSQLPELDFDQTYNCLFNLDKAFLFLSECQKIDDEGYHYLEKYQQFLIENTWKEGKNALERGGNQYHGSALHFQFKYGQLTLEQNGKKADQLFINLVRSVIDIDPNEISKITTEHIDLVSQCFKDIFNYEDKKLKSERFFNLWKILLGLTIKYNRIFFLRYLLLDWYWRDDADNWPVIKQNKTFFISLIKNLGSNDPPKSVELMAGIGFSELFPDSIALFKQLIQARDEINWVASYNAEKYIQRSLFINSEEIKNSKVNTENFIFILDKMIKAGSSVAFLVKDTLISV